MIPSRARSKFLRFAVASEDLTFYHNRLNFPEAEANAFAPVFTKPSGSIMDAVPRDNHAFFLNVEFSY